MPRFLVERTFPDGLAIPLNQQGAEATFCIYDAPTPEAIRRAAQRNALPVDRIVEVSVLDPYFYR